jgi:hypothetical protein
MGELETKGVVVEQWGAKGLPNGQPKATWYDKHGRSFVLPADPYSLDHYQGRGLMLHPPESPEPLVEDNDWSEGSANATRGGPIIEEAHEELFGGLPSMEPERKGRGPDKKPRKRRKKRRNRV